MRVSIGSVRLFVEVFGQEQVFMGGRMQRRHALVGLHGGPGQDGTTLRHGLAPLADTAQVLVPDLRGHGRSDHGTPADWGLATWAADIYNLNTVLGVDRPVLLGQSFGGFVAQQYAFTYRDQISGLVLVSTAPRYPGAEAVIARAREVGGSETASALRRGIENPDDEASPKDRELLQALYERRHDPDLEELKALVVHTPAVAHAWVPTAQQGLDLRSSLVAVKCPTLVLVGALDPINPPALAQEIVDAMPHGLAELRVVPDAAHRVLNDNPDFTHRCIREFIRLLA